MTTASVPSPPGPVGIETLADLLERLGSIPPARIRFRPYPGTAGEQDVVSAEREAGRLCELVDGVLVEKPVGYYESRLAVVLIFLLEEFVSRHDLGIVLGPDATLRLVPGLIRLPDVSFISWSQLPGRVLPAGQVADLRPDLAVEILSPTNTAAEMERKRREYFSAGARLIWELDPETRTAMVYAALDRSTALREEDSLDGADVLPGFRLTLREWFARAGPRRDRPARN